MKLPDFKLPDGKSALQKHPYIATALLCLFSLLFTQEHQVGKYTLGGTKGDFVLLLQVPLTVLCAVFVYAVGTTVRARVKVVALRVLYLAGAVSVSFLAFYSVTMLGANAVTGVAAALAGVSLVLGALLLLIGERAAALLAFAAGLCASIELGASYAFVFFAVVLYCLYILADRSMRSLAALCVPLTAAAAVLCLVLIDAPMGRLFLAGAVLSLGAYVTALFRRKKTVPPLILLMFGLGLVMRFCYVISLYLPQNQHDVFSFFTEYPRHATYIKYIYENWSLPDIASRLQAGGSFSIGLSQYYHPPLHHFFAAVWMKAQTLCGVSLYAAYENVQYLTITYSALMMVVGYRLFKEFKLNGAALYTAFAVLAFHPTFYIFAGSVNNDPLTTLFLFLAMLYTVRWYKDKSCKNTVMLALAIGLGMLTKLSGAMIAFGTGFVFLYALFTESTGGFVANLKALWRKLALFAAICFPLGLWWPVRCYVKYGMPIGFVPALGKNSDMYLGDYSVFERLTGAGEWHLSNIYPNVGGTAADGSVGKYFDYGIAPYIVKSSLFGEYFNKTNVGTVQNVFGYIMFFSAVVLILISLAGLVVGLITKDRKNGIIEQDSKLPFAFLIVYYVFLVGSYVIFCFNYPHTCTMDFRYIVPTLLIGAVWSGLLINGRQRRVLPVKVLQIAATVLFAVSSVAFYFISYC